MKPFAARLEPTRENFLVMLDLLCALIEAGIIPAKNSPLHHSARWLVDDAGHKSNRRKTRLSKNKPRSNRKKKQKD